jgi:phytanoyl-CoA hydroxylase
MPAAPCRPSAPFAPEPDRLDDHAGSRARSPVVASTACPPDDTLGMPEGTMLSQSQIDEYNKIGAIVVPDVLSAAEVDGLRTVTDDLVRRARGLTTHNDIYDLEDTHTPDNPRVRRIKATHLQHAVYAALLRHPRIIGVLRDLWGPDIRFDTAKLNMKCAGYGAPVEWHQDWAFYPHTNDDLAAVGVMMDDMAVENGPLLIVPGSHRGPTFDHHADGVFCGAMDPANQDVDYASAIPLLGKAGSITVHHVRAVHGSAPNLSDRDRRLLLFQFRAADAWPLLGFPGGIDKYKALMVAGEHREPRMAPAPVRLPLPPAAKQGSLYENQKGMRNKFFTDTTRHLEPAQ